MAALSPEDSHDSSRSAHAAGHEGAPPDHTSITLDLGHSSRAVEYELRRGLFEAAVNRDHDKARALLDVMERVLESKMKLELYLLKMYATPTLWFWSFAYTTHNPLHVACRLGDDVMVEILLKGGIHPDLLDKTQGAPFSFYELCQGRGKSSANVLASPLHVAVTHGHTNVIDMLVAHKANINIFAQTSFFSQSQRVPPIFLADSADVVATLIRHRANFLVVPGKGNNMSVTVLQRAMLKDRSDLENVLKEWGADVALTPLHEASAMGDLPTVKHYLSLGIPPDQLGEYHDGVHRRTPLHWASIMGRHAVATELLAHKADVHALDARFRSPLHWAARHCHVETVEVLLQAGANPLQCDADGLTPLAFSAAGGLLNGPCVELFHLYGVDINAQLPTATGDTCLHLALREGHQEVALALIQHGGARLASYNALGEPAIKCCASAEQLYAIKLSSHWVDIVISYDSVYRQLAEHLKQGIEESYLTVSMRDAHAGSAQHSMDAMRRASAVVCVLTPGFERNPICMEELAFAKEHRVPVMAITIATMNLPEELQVYLFTRQLVPFRDAILASRRSSVPSPGGDETRELRFKLDDAKFKRSLQNLIDGLRDEVELHALGLARTVGDSDTGDHDDHDETARSRSLYFLRTGTGVDTASISDMGGERSRATSSPRTNRGGLFLGSNAKRRTLNAVVRDVLSRRRRSMVLPHGSRHPLQRASVFLSHGDCHADFVAKVQQELRRHEIPVTLDSISQVASMKERILAAKDAILQCDIFLVVLSEKSVKTELVSDQLAFAEDKGKHIVPIYYTRRPGLVDSTLKQLLEALDRPVRIFGNGISYGRGFDELLEELRHEEELELQRQQDEMDGREWVPVSPAARQAVDLLLGGHLPGGSVFV
jgi:ankyrin repeat protein